MQYEYWDWGLGLILTILILTGGTSHLLSFLLHLRVFIDPIILYNGI